MSEQGRRVANLLQRDVAIKVAQVYVKWRTGAAKTLWPCAAAAAVVVVSLAWPNFHLERQQRRQQQKRH